MALTIADVLADPEYQNANQETKQAIFDKRVGSDEQFKSANRETQDAIRQKWGLSSAEKSNTEKFMEPFKDVSAQDFAKNSLLGSAANYLFQKSPVGRLLPNTLASIAPVNPEQRQRIQGLDQPATASNMINYAANGSPVNRALQTEARENVADYSRDKGFSGTLPNIISGAAQAVQHPIDTATGLYEHATTNPYGFAGELAKGALYDPELLGNPGARAIELGAKAVASPITVPYKLTQGALNVGRGELGSSTSALHALTPEHLDIIKTMDINPFAKTAAHVLESVPKSGKYLESIGESIARDITRKNIGALATDYLPAILGGLSAGPAGAMIGAGLSLGKRAISPAVTGIITRGLEPLGPNAVRAGDTGAGLRTGLNRGDLPFATTMDILRQKVLNLPEEKYLPSENVNPGSVPPRPVEPQTSLLDRIYNEAVNRGHIIPAEKIAAHVDNLKQQAVSGLYDLGEAKIKSIVDSLLKTEGTPVAPAATTAATTAPVAPRNTIGNILQSITDQNPGLKTDMIEANAVKQRAAELAREQKANGQIVLDKAANTQLARRELMNHQADVKARQRAEYEASPEYKQKQAEAAAAAAAKAAEAAKIATAKTNPIVGEIKTRGAQQPAATTPVVPEATPASVASTTTPVAPIAPVNKLANLKDKLVAEAKENTPILEAPVTTTAKDIAEQIKAQKQYDTMAAKRSIEQAVNNQADIAAGSNNFVTLDTGAHSTQVNNLAKALEKAGISQIPDIPGMTTEQVIRAVHNELQNKPVKITPAKSTPKTAPKTAKELGWNEAWDRLNQSSEAPKTGLEGLKQTGETPKKATTSTLESDWAKLRKKENWTKDKNGDFYLHIEKNGLVRIRDANGQTVRGYSEQYSPPGHNNVKIFGYSGIPEQYIKSIIEKHKKAGELYTISTPHNGTNPGTIYQNWNTELYYPQKPKGKKKK